jgi:hypothetical protein
MTSDSRRTHWRLACVGIATLLELAPTRAASSSWWQSEDARVSSRPDDPMPVESREGQAAAGFRRGRSPARGIPTVSIVINEVS